MLAEWLREKHDCQSNFTSKSDQATCLVSFCKLLQLPYFPLALDVRFRLLHGRRYGRFLGPFLELGMRGRLLAAAAVFVTVVRSQRVQQVDGHGRLELVRAAYGSAQVGVQVFLVELLLTVRTAATDAHRRAAPRVRDGRAVADHVFAVLVRCQAVQRQAVRRCRRGDGRLLWRRRVWEPPLELQFDRVVERHGGGAALDLRAAAEVFGPLSRVARRRYGRLGREAGFQRRPVVTRFRPAVVPDGRRAAARRRQIPRRLAVRRRVRFTTFSGTT